MKKQRKVITVTLPVQFMLIFLLFMDKPLVLITLAIMILVFFLILIVEKAWRINCDEIKSTDRKLNRICYLGFNSKFIFVGEFKAYQPDIDSEQIIIDLKEKVYDKYGECSSNWLENITIEQSNELNDSINKTFQSWLSINDYKPVFGELKILKSNRESEGK